MSKTKAQVVTFLNSKVGQKVPTKPSSDLDGQCVTLEKALLEFLGVPNPYAARGHAKDYANTLLAQGIAEKGRGQINVCVNPRMGYINGIYYGHIWTDIEGVANYEQNGARALYTTKNTRPISQATQVVNLDKWIGGKEVIGNENHVKIMFRQFYGRDATTAEIKKFKANTLEYLLNAGLYKNRKDLRQIIKERDDLKKKLAEKAPIVSKSTVVDYINKNLK